MYAAEHAAPRLATTADATVVTRILVDAFHDDPMWDAWAFPDPSTRRHHRETIFRILVEGAMRYPYVWLNADETAAAVWIPPGGTEMSAEQESRIDTVLRESLGDRADAVLHAFELFEQARPKDPHFYLTMLGTDPGHAGKGLGGRLLHSNLWYVDRAQMPAYLEARDELVPFYERFGFRLLDRFDLSDGPTVNAMWRAARPVAPGPTGV
jgi:GNAT superfamily N-acetyltransferase